MKRCADSESVDSNFKLFDQRVTSSTVGVGLHLKPLSGGDPSREQSFWTSLRHTGTSEGASRSDHGRQISDRNDRHHGSGDPA
jgi:hypothetical protein